MCCCRAGTYNAWPVKLCECISTAHRAKACVCCRGGAHIKRQPGAVQGGAAICTSKPRSLERQCTYLLLLLLL